jgi:hypothetical protein
MLRDATILLSFRLDRLELLARRYAVRLFNTTTIVLIVNRFTNFTQNVVFRVLKGGLCNIISLKSLSDFTLKPFIIGVRRHKYSMRLVKRMAKLLKIAHRCFSIQIRVDYWPGDAVRYRAFNGGERWAASPSGYKL